MQHGADLNDHDDNDNAALHYAAKGGHCKSIDFLTQEVADVNAMDRYGDTALNIAVHVYSSVGQTTCSCYFFRCG